MEFRNTKEDIQYRIDIRNEIEDVILIMTTPSVINTMNKYMSLIKEGTTRLENLMNGNVEYEKRVKKKRSKWSKGWCDVWNL